MKIVIAGNGILALTTAFRLARRLPPTDEIAILGSAARPGSATLAAAAMLSTFAEVEAGSLDSALDRYRFELSRQASRMWPALLSDLVEAGAFRLPPGFADHEAACARGTYILENAAADHLDDENFDAIARALAEFDEPHQHVAPRDIPNYAPAERHRATRALYLPNEGWLNPRRTMSALEAALAGHSNVHFIEGTVRRLEVAGDSIGSILLDDGRRIEGDKYLLATGATAGDILRDSNVGLSMPRIFYGIGASLEIRSPDHPHRKCIRTPNRGMAWGVYTVPFFTGPAEPPDHILIGATNLISPVPSHFGRLSSVESLMRAAVEQINIHWDRAELVRVNVGWRPTSQDTYPLIGPTSIPNLVIATGTKRDGFHLSPLLSEYIASMLLGEPTDPRFAVFAPERKPIRNLTRAQAIAKGVRHLVSAAAQHGAPTADLSAQMIETYRADLEALHDRVGATDWGIPPELIEIYRDGHAGPSEARARG